MFSHIFVGVSSFTRIPTFYTLLMEAISNKLRFFDRERPWPSRRSHPEPRPLFLTGRPYDGQLHIPGRGQMTALLALNRLTVDKADKAALAMGDISEGERIVETWKGISCASFVTTQRMMFNSLINRDGCAASYRNH